MRTTALLLFLLLPLLGADKKIAPVEAGTDVVEITAAAIVGRDAVKTALGVDPGVDLIVVDARVRPKSDTPVVISRDDFVLISRSDGQRSAAMHPSQIAGSGTLMVSSTGPSGPGGMIGRRRGPIWGGVPGTGDRPRRIGGEDDNAVGGASDGHTETTVSNRAEKDNPVLAALRRKELPVGKSTDTTSGLLYFIFEGKHKLKDLELMYKAPGGTLMLDFQK